MLKEHGRSQDTLARRSSLKTQFQNKTLFQKIRGEHLKTSDDSLTSTCTHMQNTNTHIYSTYIYRHTHTSMNNFGLKLEWNF